ncbi:MAG TPA: DNA gyrase subunit B [Propylenella sp.]
MANEAAGGAGGRPATSRTPRSESDLARDAEALQDQIEALKKDIATISATLADLVKSGLREGRDTVREKADLYRRQGQEQAEAAIEEARAYGEALEARISRNPFSAVLVALGLGFLIGLLSRR